MKNNKAMTIYEVVKKLVGSITPVGASHIDALKLDSLEQTTDLIDRLLSDVIAASEYKDRHEESMKQIGKQAAEFLNGLNERWIE